jgi:tripeptide aminopeptidase
MEANTERLVQEFTELVQIDSVSYQERQMADRVKEKLQELGFTVTEDPADAYDDQKERAQKGAGNLYGFRKGTLPGAPLLLSAHLDTVTPGLGKRSVFHETAGKQETPQDFKTHHTKSEDNSWISSEGDTVLGADDVSGLVEILEGIRIVQESGLPCRDIEVLFPVAEEAYARGSAVFDFSKIQSKEAYVLDLSGPVGTAALRAPSLISFAVTVNGRASHAGFAPEQGIHAIAIASRAIGELQQGRLDDETTLNIGTITGGQATNIVPECCTCRGEIRSYSHPRALEVLEIVRQTFESAAHAAGAESILESRIDLIAYETDQTAPAVQNFLSACRKLEIQPHLTQTFGGSDNNNFALHGIAGIVLSCGMEQVHSTEEYIRVSDLSLGAQLVAHLITQVEPRAQK